MDFREMRSRAEARLKARLGDARVLHEAGDLVGQGLVGGLGGTLLRAGLHAVLIAAAAAAADLLLRRIFFQPPCAAACLMPPPGGAAECCPWSGSLLIRASAAWLVAAAGSFVSTRLTPRRRFQGSALLAAVMLLAAGSGLCGRAFPWWFSLMLLVLLWLAFFAGYRLAVRAGRSKKAGA